MLSVFSRLAGLNMTNGTFSKKKKKKKKKTWGPWALTWFQLDAWFRSAVAYLAKEKILCAVILTIKKL